jgi:hypothetical protein
LGLRSRSAIRKAQVTKGNVMIVVYAAIAAALLAGAIAGAIAVLSMGIRREERAGSLARQSPGPAASAARAVNGLYVRIARPGSHHPPSHDSLE